MPPTPDPAALHQAFAATHPVDWGDAPLSTAEITRLHGARATQRSLQLLDQATAVEPTVTGQFLDSLPPGTTPYQLARRVKSPESLARKLVDWEKMKNRFPVDDVLRYTVLAESPDELVAAARRTADALTDQGWKVRYAMHSYTAGSRYKGVHTNLLVPGALRVEVQIHSVASAEVKELTTRWYQIERSATASAEERAMARLQCVEASAGLVQPRDIDGMTRLGGKRVAVNNYSDSRAATADQATTASPRTSTHSTTLHKNGGIAR
ncbi:hypothetical protein [Kribbella sp.]|uniref:hypothetical protein n=1 Tax=Kribbella sp. TaxID=1871183 RepID=UPI002D6C13EA|nr:hypothetical protein [Kribbella sp.]HZX01331.1 hypothetical protein [Kribbella sp.]